MDWDAYYTALDEYYLALEEYNQKLARDYLRQSLEKETITNSRSYTNLHRFLES